MRNKYSYNSKSQTLTDNLGDLVKEFRPGISVFILLVVISFFVLFLNVWIISHEIDRKTIQEIILSNFSGIILVVVLLLMTLTSGLFHLKTYILAYENGILYKGPFKSHVVKFDDIQEIWSGFPFSYYQRQILKPSRFANHFRFITHIKNRSNFIYINPEFFTGSHVFYFITNQGLKISLSSFLNIYNISLLHDFIEEKFFEYKFPKIFQSYQSGEKIYFGPYTIEQAGLTFKPANKNYNIPKSTRISWLDIQKISIDKIKRGKVFYHYVSIFTNNPEKKFCIRVVMSKIPNLNIFIALILRIKNINVMI